MKANDLNEARSRLPALGHNLATFRRCIEWLMAVAEWSPTSIQLQPIKIGTLVLGRARAITFHLTVVEFILASI